MPYTSKGKRPLFVDALVEIGTREIVRAGVTSEQMASEIMLAIAGEVCFRFCRQNLYIPAFSGPERAARDAMICDEYSKDGPDGTKKFTGARIQQLTSKHQLSGPLIYTIIRNGRAQAAQRLSASDGQEARA